MELKNKDILFEVYKELMTDARDVRNSATKYFINFSTVILVVLGWCETNYTQLTIKNRIFFSIGLISIILFFFILNKNMKKYYLNCCKSVNKIDRLMGNFTVGEYITDEALFPKDWENFGDKSWKEPIFEIAKYGLVFLAILGVVIIWTL